MNRKNSRRQFLKGAIGGLGGIITAHIAGLFPEAQPVLAKSTARNVPISEQVKLLEVGELYAGFLLLPEQAPLPGFVRPSGNGVPNVCGIGAEQGGPVATAIVTMFANVADLNKAIEIPIHDVGYLPEGAKLQAAHSLRHENGELFRVIYSIH
ncbi:MAG: hypothetical protein KF770_20960 [Anaerolineae bacterium]|nr:hypothetical protein [Anaerolineae bacterium]